jgi:hypothetical protein
MILISKAQTKNIIMPNSFQEESKIKLMMVWWRGSDSGGKYGDGYSSSSCVNNDSDDIVDSSNGDVVTEAIMLAVWLIQKQRCKWLWWT